MVPPCRQAETWSGLKSLLEYSVTPAPSSAGGLSFLLGIDHRESGFFLGLLKHLSVTRNCPSRGLFRELQSEVIRIQDRRIARFGDVNRFINSRKFPNIHVPPIGHRSE